MPWARLTVELPILDDHRVDHLAEVVDRHEAVDADHAGVGIDLTSQM